MLHEIFFHITELFWISGKTNVTDILKMQTSKIFSLGFMIAIDFNIINNGIILWTRITILKKLKYV